MVNDEMQELFEGYLVESNELLDSISQDLMIIENDSDNPDLINQLFRSFHTIKGTSGFMGFDNISGLTHEAEDLLNKVRKDELKINREIIDVLLEVHDLIEDMIEKIKNGDESPTDYSKTVADIKKIRGEESSSSSSQDQTTNSRSGASTTASGVLDDVINDESIIQGEGDFSDEELERLQAAFAEVNAGFVDETSNSSDDNSVKNVEDDKDKEIDDQIKSAKEEDKSNNSSSKKKIPTPAKTTSESIRIDVNRIETLMDLSGELVLGRNRLAQLVEKRDNPNKAEDIHFIDRELAETTSQIDFVTSEIQSAVMKMRMVPVAKLYQKAPRIVRELAKEMNKKIELVVKGEETEIDRGIIEELNDPLVHMIRNSCDHGIEDPKERINAGKNEVGTVTLDADQEGNHILLKIIDDGKGMDAEKLIEKAIEKGVITSDQARTMTDREAYQLIFAPGFSTAQVVTDVSGRGVGMDVVKTNIQKLKGMVEINSELGKGTTFIIKLPLTLAIIQGLLVMVKDETYAIPLTSVEEVVSLDDNEINTINGQEVIRIRENVYPIMRLNSVLGLEDDKTEGKNVVLVGVGIERIGLVVDKLLGQQEIVIKSLGKYLGSIKGLAGSTILGDGRVIMIIDVAEMVNEFYKG